MTEFAHARLDARTQQTTERDPRQPRTTVSIERDLTQIRRKDARGNSLCHDGNPVRAPHHMALQNRPFDDSLHMFECNWAIAELLGHDCDRGTGRSGCAERKVPGSSPHHDGDVPALGGSRVFHQV